MASCGRANSIITMNNIAVSMIRLEKYDQARSFLTSALVELKHFSKGVSICSTISASDEHQSADTIPVDAWMSDLSTPQHRHTLLPEDALQDSFFLYREAIHIPASAADNNNNNYDHGALSKAISFVVFFNQALAHHLLASSCSTSGKLRTRLAATADQLYRLALQYRKEERTSEGKFLLAVCNNMSVLDRQYMATTNYHHDDPYRLTSPGNTVGAGFEYLRCLLVRFRPSSSSTAAEVAIWHNYLQNVGRVMAITKQYSIKCASAA